MDPLMRLGIFLLLFGMIVFGSKYLLSRRTEQQIDDLDDTIPSYFRTQTGWMVRLVIFLVLIIILYLIMSRSS
ncbi:MAG: hypothetical protein QGH61_06420 [Candidatus Marinimicrobia bacterium]|jgi:uncharacterized membrane protein YidH (DUF202 family)|nr:hypothetical protein [Candidatus Neomarinimicrobiota bacterium]|tara:strand:+ start:753 stop:971 length:219 start_codon:yes stop_codon:yes gene_type:complete